MDDTTGDPCLPAALARVAQEIYKVDPIPGDPVAINNCSDQYLNVKREIDNTLAKCVAIREKLALSWYGRSGRALLYVMDALIGDIFLASARLEKGSSPVSDFSRELSETQQRDSAARSLLSEAAAKASTMPLDRRIGDAIRDDLPELLEQVRKGCDQRIYLDDLATRQARTAEEKLNDADNYYDTKRFSTDGKPTDRKLYFDPAEIAASNNTISHATSLLNDMRKALYDTIHDREQESYGGIVNSLHRFTQQRARDIESLNGIAERFQAAVEWSMHVFEQVDQEKGRKIAEVSQYPTMM
ncbi:hypothetical protein [Nocardia yamanashiensis]|uniref:hypothetical protein n=1 Tax=Nocardia yamanashiensis TaxID=209247 RepID=UPI0012FD4371|nr:hypothetical protein [Nocardia yamanashiensis]